MADRFRVHRTIVGDGRKAEGFSKAWLRCPTLAERYSVLLECRRQGKRRQALLGSHRPRNTLASDAPRACPTLAEGSRLAAR